MNERNFNDRILLEKYAKKMQKLVKQMSDDGVQLAVADIGYLRTDKIFMGYSSPGQYENSKPTIYFRVDAGI